MISIEDTSTNTTRGGGHRVPLRKKNGGCCTTCYLVRPIEAYAKTLTTKNQRLQIETYPTQDKHNYMALHAVAKQPTVHSHLLEGKEGMEMHAKGKWGQT